MDELLRLALSISILMIIYSLVESIVGKTKNARYVKNVMLVLAVIISIDFFYNFDISSSLVFDTSDLAIDNTAVWNNALVYIEESLEQQMSDFTVANGLSIDSIDVSVGTNYSEFQIKNILITGADAQIAKNLISGHFDIALAYINTE